MRLDTEFVRLPLRFDAARLAAEIEAIDESAWRPHPQGEDDCTALVLVGVGGDPADDKVHGPMLPTPHLEQSPYLQQVLASFETVIGRTRLMRIKEEGEVSAHADTNYYWWERTRIHVPILTGPEVQFHCGSETTHMAAGEAWVFDTWRRHKVENPRATERIHLVCDTVGTAELWSLVDTGRDDSAESRLVEFDPGASPQLDTESVNLPVVMSPWELARHLDELRPYIADAEGMTDELLVKLDRASTDLTRRWRGIWAQHGDSADGWRLYDGALARLEDMLVQVERKTRMKNGIDSAEAIRQMVVRPALNPHMAGQDAAASLPSAAMPRSVPGGGRQPAAAAAPQPTPQAAPGQPAQPARPTQPQGPPIKLDRPVFIVSSPRSGSSLLFETLAMSPSAWTIGGESHRLIESVPGLHPAAAGWQSNRLDASHATGVVVNRLARQFVAALHDRDGGRPYPGAVMRMVEKTPKNALRIPFLAKAFPDARFVYLYRDPRETISSMIDAWKSSRFTTYPELPDWAGPPWSLLLTPGWRELSGQELPHIVAKQWETTTSTLLDDLEALEPDRWCVASYDKLVNDAQSEVERLCTFLDLAWDKDLDAPLPLSRHTLDSPQPEKWRRNAAALAEVMPIVEPVALRAHEFFAERPAIKPKVRRADPPRPVAAPASPALAAVPGTTQAPYQAGRPQNAPAAAADSFRSSHTNSFPELLRQMNGSIVVSTYQSGRVIVLRADENGLNTHFCSFVVPMGLTYSRGRLAIGTKRSVWEYRNQPAVAAKLPPAGKYDAAFLPKASHVTGDVRIHEIGYVDDELWMVNTRFSCLSTFDRDHSFVPVWRPKFISALSPEDRCHLNGMAIVDGKVKTVSALGETDEAQGWRENKASGGILIDIESDEIIARKLSFPHSPRWHDGKLWVLESGKGSLSVVDPDTGEAEVVTELPGFTRGLCFVGPYAVIGLSQVRERLFGGIPLTDRLAERHCGVWVVDTRSAEIVAFLKFEGVVQEVFDIQVLPGMKFPNLVEPETPLADSAFVLPTEALADVELPEVQFAEGEG